MVGKDYKAGGIAKNSAKISPSLSIFLSLYVYRERFPCLHGLIKTQEGLGEFETVMQTRDEVEGLHKCQEFSQTLFHCFYKITSSQNYNLEKDKRIILIKT